MRAIPFLLMLLLIPQLSLAAPGDAERVYQQAMQLAAAGHEGESIAALNSAATLLDDGNNWKSRMQLAAGLIAIRRQQSVTLPDALQASVQAELARGYIRQHPAPEKGSTVLPGLLASIIPGSGHAWIGRWRDALVAAIMVWPMLLLTLWAAYRRMGPVTVFFAIITVWLWSGTVFSAVSLSERGGLESYLAWWQGLWQASALPGRPW